jgi:hypothetical protein
MTDRPSLADEKTKEQPDPARLLEDIPKTESGMLLRDMVNRAAQPPDPNACDTRAQSPLMGGLQNTCNLNVLEIYDRAKDSTFKILNHDLEAIGSGAYACSRDGKACAVVTNYHVAKLGPVDGTVYLQSDRQIYLGRVVTPHSAGNDLALIQPLFPDLKQKPLTPVEFGKAPARNDSVLSVCYPSSRLTVPVATAGKVLNPDGQVHVNDGSPGLSPPSIITDQSIYGGCSGGPDFDRSGKYVGVTRANGSDGTVVIKADHVLDLLDAYEKTLAPDK